jgi:hypothetical protein
MTPSLTHLKLVGTGNFLNGNRWEKFIQKKLCILNQFEFFFKEARDLQPKSSDMESIIASFQTNFWLEKKKWFIIAEYNVEFPELIKLYSIPICVPSLDTEFESRKISLSTFPNIYDNGVSMMDNANTLTINFDNRMTDDLTEQVGMKSNFSAIFLKTSPEYILV